MNENPKIVTIGGGTGQFTVLSGIKKYTPNITAIVNMVDDGGSTGVLRDEIGALPAGDIRQCLVALSKSSKSMRDLFSYRFSEGSLKGHNFGNLFLSALEKTTGDFEKAIEETSLVLAIIGKVVPVTTADTHLFLKLKNGKIIKGENLIDHSYTIADGEFEKLFLKPEVNLNKKAKKAILDADIIIIGPGTLYSSVASNFLVEGMKEALKKSKALKVYVTNLVNKPGQTDGFSVLDYINFIGKYLGEDFFDIVLYNNKKPDLNLVHSYEREGEDLVYFNNQDFLNKKYKAIGADLISEKISKKVAGDLIERNLIRHDRLRLAEEIMKIWELYGKQ